MRGATWIVTSLIFCGTISHATDTRAVGARRQVIDCMNKRMNADRTLSYNDATRLCKEQVSQLVAQQNSFAGSTGAGQAVASSAAPLRAVSAP